MCLLFNLKNQKILEIQLVENKHVIDKTHLTISPHFDILLIKALDKILSRNKIIKLSLKNIEIRGKMKPAAVYSMVLQTVYKALRV